jgi:hypothetical protein
VPKSDGSVQFKLKQSLASTLSSANFSTVGVLTGPHAAIAGLLYPVAFMQMGPGALETLEDVSGRVLRADVFRDRDAAREGHRHVAAVHDPCSAASIGCSGGACDTGTGRCP